ncbi:formylglycine-generating enzyme family protein [Rudanella lutea]|uniref:formylglycine-generating enzyme family protein n=1 Tax=Rudanella lutea TaxID=451374 RepID=UPI000382405A|nr:formylglycine-generating enzyme family protein [Rudanella lutea]
MRLSILCLLTGVLAACESAPSTHSYAPGIETAATPDAFAAPPSSVSVAAPAGMVLVPGGVTQIGSAEGLDAEKPVIWARIAPFFIDASPVTVAQFRAFVQATGYKTQAETFGDGGVFSEENRGWTLVKGACWHHPQGPDAPPAPDNHPVTQVSWNDANAYAIWAKKRLPSELEWEHAARNGRNDQTLYPFGNDLVENGKPRANTWNGIFPEKNANTDGFRTTSPVGYFGKTPLGLTDMTGNVWEWCADWRMNYGDLVAGKPAPTTGDEKAMRGGSFLCEPSWCHGYRVSGRSFSTPETGLMHVGFRCVRSVQ